MHECSRFFCQGSFLGIRFADLGLSLNHQKRANGLFWDRLYTEVIQRFPTIDDLPSLWVREKKEVAIFLESLLIGHGDGRIYSFGGGLGVVERFLADAIQSEIVLADFSVVAGYYAEGVTISRHDALKPVGSQFSAVIAVQVFYALDKNQIERVLREFYDLLLPGGTLIQVNSLISCELQLESASKPFSTQSGGFVSPPRALWRSARLRFARMRHLRQGWGWVRCQNTYEAHLIEAGFLEPRHIEHAGGTFTVAKKGFPGPT